MNPYDTERSTYLLMAVVRHYGGVNSGHYITYRRKPVSLSEPSGRGGWVHVSDAMVHEVPESVVLSCEAYMLFYERLDRLGLPTGPPRKGEGQFWYNEMDILHHACGGASV